MQEWAAATGVQLGEALIDFKGWSGGPKALAAHGWEGYWDTSEQRIQAQHSIWQHVRGFMGAVSAALQRGQSLRLLQLPVQLAGDAPSFRRCLNEDEQAARNIMARVANTVRCLML